MTTTTHIDGVDDLLAGIRELSREVAVVVDRLDRIECKLDHLTGVSEQ